MHLGLLITVSKWVEFPFSYERQNINSMFEENSRNRLTISLKKDGGSLYFNVTIYKNYILFAIISKK